MSKPSKTTVGLFQAGDRTGFRVSQVLSWRQGATFAAIIAWGFLPWMSVDAQDWKFNAEGSSSSVVPHDVSDSSRPEVDRFRFDSAEDIQRVQISSSRTQSLPHDDFVATAKVGANFEGIQLALRLVIPGQIDPRTRKPMITLVRGDRLSRSGVIQTLAVAGTPKAVEATIRQLRTETFEMSINSDGAYFDGCVLIAEVHKGQSFVEVGKTTYGPVVSVPDMQQATVVQPMQPSHIPVQINRDRIVMGDRSVYPRFLPDHGESVSFLKRLGVNAVWVSDLSDTDRMKELIENEIVVVATPPHPEFDPTDFRAPLQGLPPLDVMHPLPSVWYLGTDVTTDQMTHLLAWGREVRSADRKLPRPLMADVRSLEGVASRQVDFVGISQHVIGGTTSFGQARNQSYMRQNSSAHLTLPWEWLQAEVAPATANWRSSNGFSPAVVEPEQILMQTVAMLSSGCRGIGFWKTQSLEPGNGEQSEVAIAIELASLYVQILEPFLVKGRVDGHIGVSTNANQHQATGLAAMVNSSYSAVPPNYSSDSVKPDAAVISSAGSSLVLLGFWDEASHLVPQDLYVSEATATVSATETASAWQLTLTGVRGLRRQPTAGGLRVRIKDFDQLAIILVSSNPVDRNILEQKIHETVERAAGLFVELATLKLRRVRRTCDEIERVAGVDSSSTQLFAAAESMLTQANRSLSNRDFPNAEKQARACLQNVRKIQSRYWSRAIQSLPTPMASPHATVFSALPDHWAMLTRVQTSRAGENLLPSGTFESLRHLANGSWLPVAPQPKFYQSNADIVSEDQGANQVLRLRTWQLEDSQDGDSTKPTLLVRSPEIPVDGGAVYEITGRVKLGQSVVSGQLSPFSIFDSDLGPEFSVRPSLKRTWSTFRIYRQPSASGSLNFWMALRGAAEVFVDNLAVRQLAAPTIGRTGPQLTGPSKIVPANRRNGSQVLGVGYSINPKP